LTVNFQFSWGIVTLGQAWIYGRGMFLRITRAFCLLSLLLLADLAKGALIATRLLIGAFEAGFYPTAVAYLSFFYTRFDLAVRVGLFYGQYAVAGAFSGSIGLCYLVMC
jgi:MFS family permease